MAPRQELQSLLETLIPNVYFQPPANVQMVYPCIVYERDAAHTEFAENKPYRFTQRYQLTVISRNADEPAKDKVVWLPMCSFNRYFAADGLHHDVFTIFF